MPVVLMIVGIVVIVAAMAFAAINMGLGVSKTLRSTSGSAATSAFMGMAGRHLLSGVLILVGGGMFVIGLILYVASKV